MAGDEEEMLLGEVEDILQEHSRITDSNRPTLIEFIKKKPRLWSNTQKYTKEEKKMAINELAVTLGAWKSLRTSMLREVKRRYNHPNYKSTWKIYQCMLFIKPVLDKTFQNQ